MSTKDELTVSVNYIYINSYCILLNLWGGARWQQPVSSGSWKLECERVHCGRPPEWQPVGITTDTGWLWPTASLLKHCRSARPILGNPIFFPSWYSLLFSLCTPSILPSICSYNLHAFTYHLVPLTSYVLSGFKTPPFTHTYTHTHSSHPLRLVPGAVDYLQGFGFSHLHFSPSDILPLPAHGLTASLPSEDQHPDRPCSSYQWNTVPQTIRESLSYHSSRQRKGLAC